ncbi:hypothetical protein ACFX1Q_040465 [Malus domestica]
MADGCGSEAGETQPKAVFRCGLMRGEARLVLASSWTKTRQAQQHMSCCKQAEVRGRAQQATGLLEMGYSVGDKPSKAASLLDVC